MELQRVARSCRGVAKICKEFCYFFSKKCATPFGVFSWLRVFQNHLMFAESIRFFGFRSIHYGILEGKK